MNVNIEWGKVYLSRGGVEMVCYQIYGEDAVLAHRDSGVGFRVNRRTGRHKRNFGSKPSRFDIVQLASKRRDVSDA